ncbi:MAG: hypothetical protein O3B74_05540 [Proteobacteria bacterium]|nr:hypothetical protein [Pseudomonadota bacterium]
MARHDRQVRIAMSRFDSPGGFQTHAQNDRRGAGGVDRPATTFELLREPMPGDEEVKKSDSPFPSLKRRTADDRAQEIVEHLKDLILNPEASDGKTGMNYRNWSKIARKEITTAVREAETSAAFREFMSANRLGGLCMRVGFLLLAAVCSFAAFWYGILFIWREYGPIWGLGATLSAFGLSIAFTAAGLLYGGERRDEAKREAMERYK